MEEFNKVSVEVVWVKRFRAVADKLTCGTSLTISYSTRPDGDWSIEKREPPPRWKGTKLLEA